MLTFNLDILNRAMHFQQQLLINVAMYEVACIFVLYIIASYVAIVL